MTTGFARPALLGLVFGLVALPFATTAVSPLQETSGSQGRSSPSSTVETGPSGNLSPVEQKFVEGAYAREGWPPSEPARLHSRHRQSMKCGCLPHTR